MAKLLTLRVPEKVMNTSKKLATEKGYINVQEFVRDVLRQYIAKEQALALRGSIKNMQSLSAKEREKIARNL